MKFLTDTPAKLDATRRVIAAALGYPKRGTVFYGGENVTGDPRYDAVHITEGLASIELSADATVAVIEIDPDTEAKLSPALRAGLKEEAELPQQLRDARDRRKNADPNAKAALRTRNTE